MSAESAVVHIDRIEQKPNGWYEAFDGNGTKYATKKREIAERVKDYLGEQATIHFTVTQNGQYTNRYLDKIEDGPAEPPALGTGDYITGQKPPIEVRRIAAATAWKCAAEMARADLGFEAAHNIANKIFYDILKKGHALEDDDIPF